MSKSFVIPRGTRTIRLAGVSDAEALRALKESVVDATWGRAFPPAAVAAWKARFATPTYFADRLAGSSSTLITKFFIAGPSTMPYGMVALKVRDERAYIGDLYVRLRHQGIGRMLLHRAEREAAAIGLEEAIADVFEGNHAAYALLVADGFNEEASYVDSSLATRVLRLSRPLGEAASRSQDLG
jgi:GNAT superfamily N-acetyltransferase